LSTTVLLAAIGMDEIERMAGAPSPRSTACFSEKLETGHLMRISASAESVSFLIATSKGTSRPTSSAAGTHASETANSAPWAGQTCVGASNKQTSANAHLAIVAKRSLRLRRCDNPHEE
jgi:hypothetical protein